MRKLLILGASALLFASFIVDDASAQRRGGRGDGVYTGGGDGVYTGGRGGDGVYTGGRRRGDGVYRGGSRDDRVYRGRRGEYGSYAKPPFGYWERRRSWDDD